MTAPFSIRPYEPRDQPFVIDSWLSSFRTSYYAGLISMSRYFNVMWPEVAAIIDRDDTTTLVAELPSGRDRLVGFICGRPVSNSGPWVHYVYTKANYRQGGNGRLWKGPGVARALFAGLGIDPDREFIYSSKTATVARLAKKIPFARWNPLVARFDEELQGHEERSA